MAAKNDTTQKIAVLAVVLVILGIVFKDKIFGRATTRTSNQRGGAGAPPPGAPIPIAGGGPVDAAPPAPTVTPGMIPVLTPEIKRKITLRKGRQDSAYSKEKLESGVNPFIPYSVDVDALERARDTGPAATSSAGRKKGKVVFSRKLTFWGAFLPGPDEPKRVIIEVGGDPQPWTGAVGEMVEGTPYKVEKLVNGDLEVILLNPTNPNEKPVHLIFEGSKDDPSRGRGPSKDVDNLFKDGGPDGGTPPPAADPAGGGSLEPAFDR